jgi:hypothetical protein
MTGKDCCSGQCGANGCTCKQRGDACIYDDECCLGICQAGHCNCAMAGAPCTSPTDLPCCGSTCSNMGMGLVCVCGPDMSVCSFDDECCSHHCNLDQGDGYCTCAPSQFGCTTNGHCCSGMCVQGKCA